MTITHQTVMDKDGQPTAALIPWDAFLEISSIVDNEPSVEEIEACREAERDRNDGNEDAFVSISKVKARLGI